MVPIGPLRARLLAVGDGDLIDRGARLPNQNDALSARQIVHGPASSRPIPIENDRRLQDDG